MIDRRRFLIRAAALAAVGPLARDAWGEVDGELAHPIEPPPALELRTMHFDRTPMYGAATTAVCGIPRVRARDDRLPLVILLPGGHHSQQPHVTGCWGWWSEYRLADADAALRRGALTARDLWFLARPAELEEFNRQLALTPYRGAVLVTPWVVGRQLQPEPHGNMVAEFLRELVARARDELPVLTTRAATGLGGMSSGGLHAIFAGSQCADVFGTVVATQPFTEDLVPPLRRVVRARHDRGERQRLRIVTSHDDHQRKSTVELAQVLQGDGVELERYEYLGAHSTAFAAGPGGVDALFTFDRALRGENADGTRPLPGNDGMEAPLAFAEDSPRRSALASPPVSRSRSNTLAVWSAVAVGAAAVCAVHVSGRRARRARRRAGRTDGGAL